MVPRRDRLRPEFTSSAHGYINRSRFGAFANGPPSTLLSVGLVRSNGSGQHARPLTLDCGKLTAWHPSRGHSALGLQASEGLRSHDLPSGSRLRHAGRLRSLLARSHELEPLHLGRTVTNSSESAARLTSSAPKRWVKVEIVLGLQHRQLDCLAHWRSAADMQVPCYRITGNFCYQQFTSYGHSGRTSTVVAQADSVVRSCVDQA